MLSFRVATYSLRTTATAVAQTPDHGINEPLNLYLEPGRQRQIEQFGGGLVQGIAQHLVAAFQRDCRVQSAKSQQAGRTQENGNGEHKQRGADAEPAQKPRGQQQLEQQRTDARIEVEVPEKDRQSISPYQGLLCDGQELPAGQRSHQGRNADHGGDCSQVWRGNHQAHALVQIPRASFARPLLDFMPSPNRSLPPAPDQDHQSGTNQDEKHHPHKQTFRTEDLGYSFGEVAGKDPTCDASSSHHPEHALRLPRSQDVIRQGPYLSRRQNSKNLYPDVKRREQPHQTRVIVGQRPEQRAIAGKKQHAAEQQIAQMNSPGNQHIARHDNRHQ